MSETTNHVLYYTSQDDANSTTWSVYREQYRSLADDEPIKGTQEWVSRHHDEATADAEARRLQQTVRDEAEADVKDEPIALSLAVFRRLTAEVVSERGPGYVYRESNCVYVKNGAPSCLVGAVLDRAGVPLSAMADEFNLAAAGHLLRTLERRRVIRLPEGEGGAALITFADALQDAQDDRDPWGTALARADQIAEVHGHAIQEVNAALGESDA